MPTRKFLQSPLMELQGPYRDTLGHETAIQSTQLQRQRVCKIACGRDGEAKREQSKRKTKKGERRNLPNGQERQRTSKEAESKWRQRSMRLLSCLMAFFFLFSATYCSFQLVLSFDIWPVMGRQKPFRIVASTVCLIGVFGAFGRLGGRLQRRTKNTSKRKKKAPWAKQISRSTVFFVWNYEYGASLDVVRCRWTGLDLALASLVVLRLLFDFHTQFVSCNLLCPSDAPKRCRETGGQRVNDI
jgi:hypothetical protein